MHYTTLDAETFLASSASRPTVSTYFIMKRKEVVFTKVARFNQKILCYSCWNVCYGHQEKGWGSVDGDPNRPARGKTAHVEKSEMEVAMSLHPTLNTTKEMVVCRELLNYTEKEFTT